MHTGLRGKHHQRLDIQALYVTHPDIVAVLELIDGPTLAERIATGAIPLDEALPIARQIGTPLANTRLPVRN